MIRCHRCGVIVLPPGHTGAPLDRAKLKRLVRQYLKEGLKQTEIAILLDITQGYVSKIANGKVTSMIDVREFEAPAHWASALINGDTSGLDYCGPSCVAEFDAWCKENPTLLNVVDCAPQTHIGTFNGLQTELLTYKCHT